MASMVLFGFLSGYVISTFELSLDSFYSYSFFFSLFYQNNFMLTEDKYAEHIEDLFLADKCKVVDFYVVPDYAEFLGKLLDPKFGRYCKQDYTQHQFIFESVAVSPEFPLGCRTTYRAYSADAVVEIKQEENEFYHTVNMVAYQAKPIRTYPEEVRDEDGRVVAPAGKNSIII